MSVHDIGSYRHGARRHMDCSCFDKRRDQSSEETLILSAILRCDCEGHDLIDFVTIVSELLLWCNSQLRPSS